MAGGLGVGGVSVVEQGRREDGGEEEKGPESAEEEDGARGTWANGHGCRRTFWGGLSCHAIRLLLKHKWAGDGGGVGYVVCGLAGFWMLDRGSWMQEQVRGVDEGCIVHMSAQFAMG